MSKSPFTCNHERLGKMMAGGPIQCLDCGHILSDYALSQLDRAERAEARVKELEGKIKLWHDALENGIFAIARSQVVQSMEKVIRGNDE